MTLEEHKQTDESTPRRKSTARWLGLVYVDDYGYGWLWKDGENKCLGKNLNWGEEYPRLCLGDV